jgi:hypothetical protein
MSQKPSAHAKQPSLVAQVTPPADQPFIDIARALLRANFLFSNHPAREYQAL